MSTCTSHSQSAALCSTCGLPVHSTYREGQEVAYLRVLAFLAALPEESATKGRDHGRGVSTAAREITEAVRSLALDAGLEV